MGKSLDQFESSTQGKSNLTGPGGIPGQCVGYMRLYIDQVLDLPQPGGKPGAKDQYLQYDSDPKLNQNFKKIGKDEQLLPGDILFWNAPSGGGYGHVAICISESAPGAPFDVVEQNFSPNKVGERSGVPRNATFLGALRPNGAIPGQKISKKALRLLGGGARSILKKFLGESQMLDEFINFSDNYKSLKEQQENAFLDKVLLRKARLCNLKISELLLEAVPYFDGIELNKLFEEIKFFKKSEKRLLEAKNYDFGTMGKKREEELAKAEQERHDALPAWDGVGSMQKKAAADREKYAAERQAEEEAQAKAAAEKKLLERPASESSQIPGEENTIGETSEEETVPAGEENTQPSSDTPQAKMLQKQVIQNVQQYLNGEKDKSGKLRKPAQKTIQNFKATINKIIDASIKQNTEQVVGAASPQENINPAEANLAQSEQQPAASPGQATPQQLNMLNKIAQGSAGMIGKTGAGGFDNKTEREISNALSQAYSSGDRSISSITKKVMAGTRNRKGLFGTGLFGGNDMADVETNVKNQLTKNAKLLGLKEQFERIYREAIIESNSSSE